MTDIEQLMQNSEAMRMLKLGNPERSKDFNLPEMPIGLFDIERMVEEPLRNMIQNSKDPNGAIEKFDTALMLNNFGYDMDTAFSMADMGFASSVTGIDTRDKTYSQAFGTTVKHSYWNEMKGINTSLYMLTKNRYFIDNADKYNQKIMNNPVFNTYGEFGDLVLDSVQPALSSVKFMAVTALLSWIPGGIASAVWGPAIGKLVAGGGGLAANAVNFLSAGYSQAGDVLYNVMQMEDANGNRLPWDSLDAQVLYHGLAGLMGLLELGSMEMFPWYKHLKSRFTHREVVKHMERGILAAGKNFLWEGTKGTISEAVEEGGQTILGIGYENLLKHWANKEGADFELTSIKETAKEAAEATYQAARSMVLTSFLSAGLGQSAYSLRLRAEAKKNFTPTANSVAVDSGFIGVPRSAVEAMEDGVAVGSMQPVKVVNVGDHLVPIDDVELKKAARAVKNGSGAMEVIVEGFPSIDTSDFTEMLHRAAIATEGKIINDSELGFETQEDLDRAMFLLALNVEAIEQNEKGSSIVIRNEDGEITKLQLSLIEEGQKFTEPDLSYTDDIQSPYSLATMAEERALEWHERNIIKEAIGDLVDHTKGRITSADLEANIDAVKLVADALKIPTDQMLKENLVFKLEKGTIKGERGYIENVTVDGKKQYTIHLSENADATTLLHELGHFIRGTASKEQLADFTKYYGRGAEAVWIEDINKVGDKYHVGEQAFDSFEEAKRLIEANEEAFADDFVAYLRTGQAPTSGLRNIFRRLKTVLSRFVEEFGYRLDPFVKNAFDRLIAGDHQVSDIDLTSANVDIAKQKLYQKASGYDAIVDRYKGTDAWMKAPNGEPTNLTERQWVMVRTPAFKRWFGDWEAAENLKWLMEADPVGSIQELLFQKGQQEDLIGSILDYWNGRVVHQPEIGNIILDKEGVKSSIGHGLSKEKASAFALVPEIIEKGRIIWREANWKDRGYDTALIVAPIEMVGVQYIAEVVVNQRPASNKYNIHEVTLKERLEGAFKTPTEGSAPRTSKHIISRLLAEGKFESSVVVDENGEPLAVYHGTSSIFEVFDSSRIGESTDIGWFGKGFYFSRNEAEASGYGENLFDVFLNIKNPFDYNKTLWKNRYDSKGAGASTLLFWYNAAVEMPDFVGDVVFPLNEDSWYSENNLTLSEIKEWIDNRSKTSNTPFADFINELNFDEDFIDENVDNSEVVLVDEVHSFLENSNYDGVVNAGETGDQLIAFYPNQIKSASNNIGTFDSANDNIFFQEAPPVNSDEFKAWFKNSKVVDERGVPLIGYHNTDELFDTFDLSKARQSVEIPGFFFTSDPGEWTEMGPIQMPAYISIQNPYEGNYLNYDGIRGGSTYTAFSEIREALIRDGYDGIITEEDGVLEIVAFYPEQVKSIFNQGTWDPNNPNIFFQKAPPKGSEEFQEIFKHTKAVNKDGSPALLYHGSPVTNLESLDNTNVNKINGGEPGYTYATDSYEAADNFAYEQLPGSSSYTYIPGERGQIYEVYMDIRNPLDFRSLSPEDIANIKDAAQKYGPFEKEVTSTIDDFIIKGRDKYSLQFIKNMAEEVVKHLEEYGYDGLITELDNNGNLEYATVSPNQVFMVSTEGLDAGESFGAMNDNKNSSTLFQNARVDSYDGLEYIKHDEGYAYDEEKIRELDTEVTEVFEDIQRWFDFESGQYIPDTEGFSGNLSGRETSEVRQSWRESRRIDFVGKKIANVKDLAEMFSVYRNNEIELFHIIYVDDQNNILAHNALSSGLPGFTIAVDSRTAARSLYRMESRMERLGASGYYMMHNHPSGNVSASQEDLAVTSMYANDVDGFKGHIILDHTEFTLLKREEGHLNHSKDRYSPVKMDARKLLSESINNQGKVMTYVSEYLTDNNKNVYLIVDTHYRLIEARPVKRPSYLSAYEAMRSAKGSYVFLGTTDRSVFNEIIKNSEKQKSGIGVFRDVVLIDDNSSVSLFDTTGKHPEWMKTAIGMCTLSSPRLLEW